MIITLPLLAVIIAIIACLYASYTDLKRGIIPNLLTFPLIGLGLVLSAFQAYLIGNAFYFISAAIITGIIFGLGYLFWRLGAWAGGDVKLFTALAALIPFYPLQLSYTILNVPFPVIGLYPFPFTLIINSILSIMPFLLIFVFYVAAKYKRHLLGEIFAPIKLWKKNIILTMVITSAVTLTFFITQQLPYQIILLSLIMVYLLSLVISKLPNQVKAVLVSLVTVFALFNNFWVTIVGIVFLFISIVVLEMIKRLLTTVNRQALQDEIPITELKEGMIPAYKLYETDDGYYFDKKSFMDKLRESIKLKDPSLLSSPPGKLLIGNLAAGLSSKDIKLLIKLQKDENIDDKFSVKKGVPFAPSIFIGLLISLFVGDLAFILEKILVSILY